MTLAHKVRLVIGGGEFLREGRELERGEVGAGGCLGAGDVDRITAGEKRSARGRAPEEGVVAVHQDALLAQRLEVRSDAAGAGALAEALVVRADRGVGETQVVDENGDDVGPGLASWQRDRGGLRWALHWLALSAGRHGCGRPPDTAGVLAAAGRVCGASVMGQLGAGREEAVSACGMERPGVALRLAAAVRAALVRSGGLQCRVVAASRAPAGIVDLEAAGGRKHLVAHGAGGEGSQGLKA
eukprot:COSAG06_NODE_4226_length_4451_cov_6.710018_3_plen_242_part_00